MEADVNKLLKLATRAFELEAERAGIMAELGHGIAKLARRVNTTKGTKR